MKKLLLTAAAVTALSTTSAYAGSLYVKGNAGFPALLEVTQNKDTGGSADEVTLSPKRSWHAGGGVGYHLMDRVRADVMFDYFNKMEVRRPRDGSLFSIPFFSDEVEENDNNYTSLKPSVATAMVNVYGNFVDMGIVKLFAGAGIGLSCVTAEWTKATTASSFGADTKKITGESDRAWNLALAGHAGLSFYLASGIDLDFSYSLRHIGKLGAFKVVDTDGNKTEDPLDNHPTFKGLWDDRLLSHQITASVRFEL